MYIHVILLIDKSGSMQSKVKATLEGVSSFILEQQSVKEDCSLTIATFNTKIDSIFYPSIFNFETLFDYEPMGMTALYDAFCSVVDKEGQRLNNMLLKPAKVICCVVTDGLENSSKQYKLKDVLERINHQREKYFWEFVFLGAGFDVETVAYTLSIPPTHTLHVEDTAKGFEEAYATFSNSVRGLRENSSTKYRLKK